MGFFSKSKGHSSSSSSEDNMLILIAKWQGWVDAFEDTEIIGKNYKLSDIQTYIDSIAREAVSRNDELLLQWTSKVCVAMLSSTKKIAPVDIMAQVMFDISVVSMDLRKRYAKSPKLLEAVTVLGLASYKVFEGHPNLNEILQYTSDNAQKLAGK